MTTASTTLREIVGIGQQPAALSDSALIMIDCQNTYRKGVMQINGIRARQKRRYKATTDSKHSFPVAPNVLNQQFRTTHPDQA